MPRFQAPPLKRHAALQPLSRNRYIGLVQARHLAKAVGGDSVDRRAAVATFLDAWSADFDEHFADEERLLAPLTSAAGRIRLCKEHARLRSMAEEARNRRRRIDPDADWIRTLGEALNNHIRWKERELLPAIESAAPGRLTDLQPEADRIEASRAHGRGGRRG